MAAFNFVSILAAVGAKSGTIGFACGLNRHVNKQHLAHHWREIEDRLVGYCGLWIVSFIRRVGKELVDLSREGLVELVQAANAICLDIALEIGLHNDSLAGEGEARTPVEVGDAEIVPKLKRNFLKFKVAAVSDALV